MKNKCQSRVVSGFLTAVLSAVASAEAEASARAVSRTMQAIAVAASVWVISVASVVEAGKGWPAQAPTGGAISTPAAPAAAAAQAAAASSVWGGVYTEAQAKRGEAIANKLCTTCHGPDLSGGEAGPTLVGLEFLGNWVSLTLADFFDRVHTTMPADSPGTLTLAQTSDLTAYVLKLNKYPAGEKDLPTDLVVLKQITIEGQPPAK
jgi:mono/diheme cytochrome c family protein